VHLPGKRKNSHLPKVDIEVEGEIISGWCYDRVVACLFVGQVGYGVWIV